MPDKPIKFSWESDGEESARTYYVIADCDDWSDCKRLDLRKKKDAQEVCRRLRAGEITMEQAARAHGEKWL